MVSGSDPSELTTMGRSQIEMLVWCLTRVAQVKSLADQSLAVQLSLAHGLLLPTLKFRSDVESRLTRSSVVVVES